MSNPQERDHVLESLLSELRLEPIADDGFSDQVMASLPAGRSPRTSPRLLLIAAIVLGTVFALWSVADTALLQRAAQEWQAGTFGLAGALLLTTLLTLASALAGWVISEE